MPVALHAAEASYVSASSLSAFRAAIVRAVWSNEMPLANARVVLVGWIRLLYTVWARLRMMRRYLAYFPEDEPRIFRLLDFISRGC